MSLTDISNAVSRYLITSADERTWVFNRPVIFLGEWCRLYARRHIWENMDYIVAAPYGLDKEVKDADLKIVRSIEYCLLTEICYILNNYHNVNYSHRAWQIILGPWLRRYTEVIYNRIQTLKQCLSKYNIEGTTKIVADYFPLVTHDYSEWSFAANNETWNSYLYGQLLSLLNLQQFPIELINIKQEQYSSAVRTNLQKTEKKSISHTGEAILSKLARVLQRDDDALIISSYLPRKEELKLHLALGQVSPKWGITRVKYTENVNTELRCNLKAGFGTSNVSEFLAVARSLLFETVPTCYLENFITLRKTAERLGWPRKPKFIFTSNNFNSDEAFKVWTAGQVDSGVKYIVGQHGNNYGTRKYNSINKIEETTADTFLTWGWTDGLQQHQPAFIFKIAGISSAQYDPTGALLLIELHSGNSNTYWDDYAEHLYYYYPDQQRFVECLSPVCKERLIIRLHNSHKHLNWNDEARWKDFDNTLQIETGKTPIFQMIRKSRLVVHSYDSTGILEALSLNIPTVAFWQNGLEHVRDSAMPYYQKLVDAGIVHLSPGSVAEKVNQIWDDVDGWWNSSVVQEARSFFCDRYARKSERPVMELKTLLLNDKLQKGYR